MLRRKVTILCASTMLYLGCPRVKNTEIEAVLMLLDVSDGSLVHQRCRELGPAIRDLHGRDFDFSVMLTGNTDQPEPTMLISWRKYRVRDDLENFVSERLKECDRAISSRSGSPLRRGIFGAALELRAHCASTGALQELCIRRILHVHSDFRESENGDIQRALRSAESAMELAHLRSVGPFSDDLELDFCGARETSTTNAVAEDHLQAIWRAVLGRNTLHIEPTCARDP